MKVSMLFAAAASAITIALLGCSSSSGGGGSIPQCQGAMSSSTGAGSSACNSCIESKCGSQLSSFDSDCSAYISCYDACQCSDTTCLSGCSSKVTAGSACANDESSITSCLEMNCTSQCTSSSSGDAG